MDNNLVLTEMKKLLSQKDYPCVAALQSYHRDDYRWRSYKNFGQVNQRPTLREDLLSYLKKYLETKSEFFTFWAIFEDQDTLSEEEFEKMLNG